MCTNSGEYPDQWESMAEYFLFDTPEKCCDVAFQGDCIDVKDDCNRNNQALTGDSPVTTTDATTTEVVVTTTTEATDAFETTDSTEGSSEASSGNLHDDFEGGGTLTWSDYEGKWRIDDTTAFSGKHSITNIPSSEVMTSTSLTLTVSVPSTSTFKCQMLIDTGMPFDRFSLYVNDELRDNFFTRIPNWTPLVFVVDAGDNVVEFQVNNGAHFPAEINRAEQAAEYGTGRVWLDQCEVLKMGG